MLKILQPKTQKESEHLHKGPEAPEAPFDKCSKTDSDCIKRTPRLDGDTNKNHITPESNNSSEPGNDSNHPGEQSQPSHDRSEQFYWEANRIIIEEAVRDDKSQPSQIEEDQEPSQTPGRVTNEVSSGGEEWQIFDKLEDDERQSGQFLEVSVSQEKFHEVLESSGIPVDKIKHMNLETVTIEKDGEYINYYRRKGDLM
jgi:hypothetical protein